MFVQEIIWRRV